MNDVFKNLFKLQQIDLKLDDIYELRGDLPQHIDDLKSQLFDLEDKYSKFLEKQNGFHLEIIALEEERLHNIEELKKDEEHLFTVSNNKEYDALTKQIANRKHIVTDNVNLINDLKDKHEKISVVVLEYQDKVTEARSSLEQHEQDLQGKIKETEADEKKLNTEKLSIDKKLENNIQILRLYRKIRSSKAKAVVFLNNKACGSCRSVLPKLKQAEVKEQKKIVQCETCGRIVIWEELEEVSK
jgi:predicted  nucleic acid-binding Zn-ribbon protein